MKRGFKGFHLQAALRKLEHVTICAASDLVSVFKNFLSFRSPRILVQVLDSNGRWRNPPKIPKLVDMAPL